MKQYAVNGALMDMSWLPVQFPAVGHHALIYTLVRTADGTVKPGAQCNVPLQTWQLYA